MDAIAIEQDVGAISPKVIDSVVTTEKAEEVSVAGADAALKYAANETLLIDATTNDRILRTTDRNILPWLCALYFFQSIDKGVWMGTIYYIGYLLAAYPHNRLLQKFPQAKYIAVCAFLWGAVLCTTAAAHNFAGLMCVRFFMGVLEATVNCGFVLVTAKWYKKYEHSSRVGIWAACAGGATMIGGVVAYGCSRGSTEAHLTFHGWKILSLVTGSITVVFAVLMYFFMAQSPIDASFFSEHDKTLAVERLRDNHQGVGSREFKWYQFREAFTDIRTWIYIIFILAAQIPNAGVSLFTSILIKSLGFSSNTTLLLGMPTGFVQICCNLGFGYLADRTKQRSLVAAGCHLINIFFVSLLVGLSKVSPLHGRYGQLIAYFVMVGNGSTPYFIMISMISSNTLGYTKKTTVNGVVFTTLGLAYLIGPQIFKDAPYYTSAKDASIGLWILSFFLLMGLYALNLRENKKRDQEDVVNPVIHPKGQAFLDLTDKENRQFRYVL
ncbi:hypothetical protein BP5796_06543 [Coleophoma crateriformis]|uniref:Major facilitator superfamily (MFS) profile domain-containing protein n=1 Tax=Coleophoma crateriformis TaxID=565419 RepID=A0A3D8RNQ2_9HELO|nr:hypothetical protein BP5796_06543 [Coleophoma crateriformis]